MPEANDKMWDDFLEKNAQKTPKQARLVRNQLYQKALEAESNKDDKRALEHYRMSLMIDSGFFDSWLNAGAIYSRQGKPHKAIICFKRALSQKPDKRAYYNLANELFRIEKYSEARETAMRAIKVDQNFFQAHVLLGYIFTKLHQDDKAEVSFKNAFKLNRNDLRVLISLALLYFHSNQKSKSEQMVQRALAIKPDDLIANRLKSQIELSDGKLTSAISVLRTIINDDPQLKNIYTSYGENEKEIKKSVAQKIATIEKKTHQTSKDEFDLSLLSLFEGNPEEALNHLTNALKKSN